MVAHGLLQNFARNLLVVDAGGVEPDVGQGFIDGSARGEEGVKGLAWMVGLEQGAATAAHGALEKHIGLCVEPNDDAGFFKGLEVGFAQDGSAAGGEDDARDTDKIGENALLDLAEDLLAAFGEDGGNALALVFDDQFIGINKTMADNRGEPTPDGGFAAAHESDEHEIR